MRISYKIATLLVLTSVVSACQQGPMGQPGQGVTRGGNVNKSDVGTLAGGIAGGVAGYQFGGGAGKAVATVAGTLLGAYLGSEIGASMDRADVAYYNQTSQRALETGQPGTAFPWENPQSGNYGTITPNKYYQNSYGDYCREYSQSITVGGRTEKAYGTACRQPDGTWKIVE
ncbi:MAG: RT0821/Lpp0805 family surface protein [Alphaproteobacteria bacterium]